MAETARELNQASSVKAQCVAVYYKTNVAYCSWRKQRQRSGFGCRRVRNARKKNGSSPRVRIHVVEHPRLGSVQDGGDKSDAFRG